MYKRQQRDRARERERQRETEIGGQRQRDKERKGEVSIRQMSTLTAWQCAWGWFPPEELHQDPFHSSAAGSPAGWSCPPAPTPRRCHFSHLGGRESKEKLWFIQRFFCVVKSQKYSVKALLDIRSEVKCSKQFRYEATSSRTSLKSYLMCGVTSNETDIQNLHFNMKPSWLSQAGIVQTECL